MNCHLLVSRSVESLAPIRDSAKSGMPMRWVRVHKLGEYAYFNHRAHVSSGVGCVSCHGHVEEMEVVRQVEPLSMSWCLDCHRNPQPHLRPLSEITNIITRIKELAVQSANGTNSSSDRTALNSEVTAMVAEVTRIAAQTRFSSTNILDGSFNGTFQVGVNAGETVSQSIANYRATALGGSVASQALTFMGDTSGAAGAASFQSNASTFTGLSATGLLVSGPKGQTYVRAAVAGDDTVSNSGNIASAIATAKVVNESTALNGVSASVTEATVTIVGSLATSFAIARTLASGMSRCRERMWRDRDSQYGRQQPFGRRTVACHGKAINFSTIKKSK
jgi:hypothetical protein